MLKGRGLNIECCNDQLWKVIPLYRFSLQCRSKTWSHSNRLRTTCKIAKNHCCLYELLLISCRRAACEYII